MKKIFVITLALAGSTPLTTGAAHAHTGGIPDAEMPKPLSIVHAKRLPIGSVAAAFENVKTYGKPIETKLNLPKIFWHLGWEPFLLPGAPRVNTQVAATLGQFSNGLSPAGWFFPDQFRITLWQEGNTLGTWKPVHGFVVPKMSKRDVLVDAHLMQVAAGNSAVERIETRAPGFGRRVLLLFQEAVAHISKIKPPSLIKPR